METPVFLLKLKAIGLKDLYHIQGFMQLLMKPRNGMRWTTEDKQELRGHLISLAETLPYLAVFSLPGGLLLLPILAWIMDRRKRGLALSVVPYPEKSPVNRSNDHPNTDSKPLEK
jgi:hypothetical protein